MSILVIVSWYLAGAWGAAWMVHRGHAAVPWSIGAALLGALLWAFALPVARRVGRRVRWATVPLPEPAGGRVVLGLVDDEGAVAATAASAASPADLLLAVRRVGFEAESRAVDTGELDRAHRALDFARRLWPGTTVTCVASGSLVDLVEDLARPHHPALIVRSRLAAGSWRRDLRRSVRLGARTGAPVLHAPADVARTAPAPRSTVGTAA